MDTDNLLKDTKVIFILTPQFSSLSLVERKYIENISREGILDKNLKRITEGEHTVTSSHLDALQSVILGNQSSMLYILAKDRIGTGITHEWLLANYPQIEGKVSYGEFPDFKGVVEGIDLNKWRADFPLHKFEDDFLYIRATFSNDQLDKTFHDYANKSNLNKIPRGAFHYLHPRANAVEQAKAFMRAYSQYKWELPPCLDIEQNVNKEKGLDLPLPSYSQVELFVKTFHAFYPTTPLMFYTNLSYNSISTTNTFGADLWAAHWLVKEPSLPAAWKEYTFWQDGFKKYSYYPYEVDHNVWRSSKFELNLYIEKFMRKAYS